MAEDLHPEVGEAGAGMLDWRPAATPIQRLARDADVAADASHQVSRGSQGVRGDSAASTVRRSASRNAVEPRSRSSLK